MFNYSKRLMANIRFWWNEIKLRSEENSKLSELQANEETEWRHPMASFGYYMTMQHNRKERKRLHKDHLAALQ